MKTSNKVLMTTFLLSVSLIYALPVAVNVKYEKKDFVITPEDSKSVYYKLTPGSTVLLSNLKKCVIVPSDSFRIKVLLDGQKSVRHRNEGDSLIVESTQFADSSRTVIFLPLESVEKIILKRSSAEINGSFNRNVLPSYSVDLHMSHLSLNTSDGRQFFDRVNVKAYDSSASLRISKQNHINVLSLLNLSQTNISYSTNVEVFQSNFDPKAVVKVLKNERGIAITSRP